jgi:hypothetical protein
MARASRPAHWMSQYLQLGTAAHKRIHSDIHSFHGGGLVLAASGSPKCDLVGRKREMRPAASRASLWARSLKAGLKDKIWTSRLSTKKGRKRHRLINASRQKNHSIGDSKDVPEGRMDMSNKRTDRNRTKDADCRSIRRMTSRLKALRSSTLQPFNLNPTDARDCLQSSSGQSC